MKVRTAGEKDIIIGDVHGRKQWQDIILANSKDDHYTFMGDYFDSHFGIHPDQQIEQFKLILEFKKANPDNVTLLLGNHDYHYLSVTKPIPPYTDMDYYKEIQFYLESAIKDGLIQMAHCVENGGGCFVFTHAGIEIGWFRNYVEQGGEMIDFRKVADAINKTFAQTPEPFNLVNSPIWTRPDRLRVHALPDPIIQVVGHTMKKYVQCIADSPYTVVMVDVLEQNKYAVIQDGIVKEHTILSN